MCRIFLKCLLFQSQEEKKAKLIMPYPTHHFSILKPMAQNEAVTEFLPGQSEGIDFQAHQNTETGGCFSGFLWLHFPILPTQLFVGVSLTGYPTNPMEQLHRSRLSFSLSILISLCSGPSIPFYPEYCRHRLCSNAAAAIGFERFPFSVGACLVGSAGDSHWFSSTTLKYWHKNCCGERLGGCDGRI